MLRAKIKDGWCVCAKCGHKLGRLTGEDLPKGLEIKCSSCKAVNLVDKLNKRIRKMFADIKDEKQAREYLLRVLNEWIIFGNGHKKMIKAIQILLDGKGEGYEK